MPKKAKANKLRAKQRARAGPSPAGAKAVVNGGGGGVGKTLGAIVGTKLGIGPAIGSALGNLAQGALKKLFGKGDYEFEVERNSLVIPKHADSVPLMGTQDGAVRIRHREYLQDIVSSTAYATTTVVVNPSNAACFPWANNIAEVFEQYRILGMIFEYKSISSTAVLSTQALGSVMMASQYNTAVLGFADKRQILNHYFGCSTVPYRDLIHPIECKEMYDPLKLYFTRPLEVVPNPRDSRFESYANFQISTQGMPTNGQVVGELWVSYDIMLYKPRIRATANSQIFIDPVGLGPVSEVTYKHVPEWVSCCDDEKEESIVSKVLGRIRERRAGNERDSLPPMSDDEKETLALAQAVQEDLTPVALTRQRALFVDNEVPEEFRGEMTASQWHSYTARFREFLREQHASVETQKLADSTM